MKTRKGFTLIELLVVISIIGLLSSVVLASLNAAREKSRIGAARYFASQVNHIAGDSLVGAWNFDECSNTQALDRSGFGNDAVISGGATVSSSNTITGTGCALDITGGYSQIATVADSISLDLTTDFTVSMWVYVRSYSGSTDSYIKKGGGTYSGPTLAYGASGNGFMYIDYNASNAPYDIRRGSDFGKWHQLTGVITGGKRYLYVDGTLIGSNNVGSTNWNNTYPLSIGGNLSSQLIDDVAVYAKGLTASEIGTHYASEVSRFKLADTK